MRFKNVFFIGIIALLSSCGSWSNQDKDKFIESCQMQKLNDEFCNCALEKALIKYNTFDEMTADEEEMAKLLFSCIEEDRKKEK